MIKNATNKKIYYNKKSHLIFLHNLYKSRFLKIFDAKVYRKLRFILKR